MADDGRFRERFLAEPRLAASLDHSSVVPIYEAGEHDGQLYLAMRYVQGSDLRTLLQREGTLDPGRALAILGQVASALDAAHRRGLVHRDVKPANVLLDEDEHAYLTDFGVSKHLGDDTGEVAGTLEYLAPEQIRGEPVDGRTDEYSLACVLYECLAGTPPFRRQTPAETLWAHLREEPPPLESEPALDPVLHRGLAQEPGERYPTCAALIAAAREVTDPPSQVLERRHRVLLAAGRDHPRRCGDRRAAHGASGQRGRGSRGEGPHRERHRRDRAEFGAPRGVRRDRGRPEQHRGGRGRRLVPQRGERHRGAHRSRDQGRHGQDHKVRACRPTSPRAQARYGSAQAAAKAETGRSPSTASIPARRR